MRCSKVVLNTLLSLAVLGLERSAWADGLTIVQATDHGCRAEDQVISCAVPNDGHVSRRDAGDAITRDDAGKILILTAARLRA